jgi:putative transcriptional regulator
MDSVRGQLLIASPALVDPNFRRTVVLVAEHDPAGALGVVLNRPTEHTVSEAVSELDREDRLHAGGPVQPSSLIVIAEFAEPELAALLIDGDIGFPGQDADLHDVDRWARRVRFFAGYAGWGPGQLDGELESEDWIVAPFEAADAFDGEADSLWSRALERKGGRFALLARMPEDPSVN